MAGGPNSFVARLNDAADDTAAEGAGEALRGRAALHLWIVFGMFVAWGYLRYWDP